MKMETNNDNKTSINLAKSLIKQFEGLRLSAYYCPASKKTIGYGHVLQEHEQHLWGMEITEQKAEMLLEQDIAIAKAAIDKYCTVPLTVNQEAALISFIFNCGVGAFARSTLLWRLNRKKYFGVGGELLRWVHVKDKRIAGLVTRRKAEQKLFLSGISSLQKPVSKLQKPIT